METPRVTIFAGRFGSGKTNLAANYALLLARDRAVALLDMDVCNPMFRMHDLKELFDRRGISFASPRYAGTNVDMPALSPEMGGLLAGGDKTVVVDVGGDDAGAVALGGYAARIEKSGYDMLFVFNRFRPFTATAEDALGQLRAIEAASRLKFTKLACNHNLGRATTESDIEGSLRYGKELSELSGLPVAFEAFDRRLSPIVPPGLAFPIDILLKRSFDN